MNQYNLSRKAFYIISSVDEAGKNQYKPGIYKGTPKSLLDTHNEYWSNPIIYYFQYLGDESVVVEEKIKQKFHTVNLRSPNGKKFVLTVIEYEKLYEYLISIIPFREYVIIDKIANICISNKILMHVGNYFRTIYEKTDKDVISRLLSIPILSVDEKHALKDYKQKISNNYVAVTYDYSQYCFGRLSTDNGIASHNFNKFHDTLANMFYDSIHIINAFPTFIYQYCKKNDIECNILKDYVKNHDYWVKRIANFHNISCDNAKNLVLKLCQLGEYTVGSIKICCICLHRKVTTCVLSVNICDNCINKSNLSHDHNKLEKQIIQIYYNGQPTNHNNAIQKLNNTFEIIFDSNNKLDFLVNLSKEMMIISKAIYRLQRGPRIIIGKDNYHDNELSIMMLMIEMIEYKCLMSMTDFFESNNFKVGVYDVNGIMVEKHHEKIITMKLLKKCSNNIKRDTGYGIKVGMKLLDNIIDIPRFSRYVKNAKEVQEKLFVLEDPEYFKYCDGKFYIFNEQDGLFTTNDLDVYYYINKHQHHFNKKRVNGIYNYSRDESAVVKVTGLVKNACHDNTWLERTIDSSIGYLLFNNGIYNMNTGIFTQGFDPHIVFYKRIPHDFPKRNEDDIKYAANMSFKLMLGNPHAFIISIGRSLYGLPFEKFFLCPKMSITNKSILVRMISSCFGNYVGFFNVNNIILRTNDVRSQSQKYEWAMYYRFCRILFSDETKTDNIIDGNIIKKISSGCNILDAGEIIENDTNFRVYFTLFYMLNHVPKIRPHDNNIISCITNPDFNNIDDTTPEDIEDDTNIYGNIEDTRFINGFTHLILNGYKNYLEMEKYM